MSHFVKPLPLTPLDTPRGADLLERPMTVQPVPPKPPDQPHTGRLDTPAISSEPSMSRPMQPLSPTPPKPTDRPHTGWLDTPAISSEPAMSRPVQPLPPTPPGAPAPPHTGRLDSPISALREGRHRSESQEVVERVVERKIEPVVIEQPPTHRPFAEEKSTTPKQENPPGPAQHSIEKTPSPTLPPAQAVRPPATALIPYITDLADLPKAAEPAPTVHVTIGRIEVRATLPPASPPRRKQSAKPAVMSLDDYLRNRANGGGR